jgi:putative membrane protein
VGLHLIGAHYTYSLVPYDRVGENILGVSINTIFSWQRNNYDRFVHFLFGLCVYQPTVEILRYYAPSIRGWVLPTFVILLLNAFSVAYEMIEWCASLMLNDKTGVDFLGSQGDIWDAHKDMILAFIGSLIAAMIFNGIFAKARTRIRSRLHRKTRTPYIGH